MFRLNRPSLSQITRLGIWLQKRTVNRFSRLVRSKYWNSKLHTLSKSHIFDISGNFEKRSWELDFIKSYFYLEIFFRFWYLKLWFIQHSVMLWKILLFFYSQKLYWHFNPLTTGKVHFWSPSFLTLWKIEIAFIFRKYEKSRSKIENNNFQSVSL